MSTPAWRIFATFALTLAAIARFGHAADEGQRLAIGDGSGWTFVNSRWSDTPEGGIAGARTGDGDGLQGYCLAFVKSPAYADVEATFNVQMNTNHADQGFIVRAQDPTRYCLLHFPQTGQQYRAQHFWAALSVADGSGYLRLKHLALVRRVASNPFGIAHQARIKVTGDRYQVWINGHPALDVHDDTYKQGRIGLSGFNTFAHGPVTVKGTEVSAGTWNDMIPQVRNWFQPFPDAGDGQFVTSLTRAPNGDLLCAFNTKGTSSFKGTVPHLGRSTDNGKTWTVEPAPTNMQPDGLPGGASVTTLRDGRLVSIGLTHGKGAWAESRDNGHTWSKAEPIEPATPWPSDPKQIVTGYQTALKDGTLLRFAYGLHSTSTEPVTKWGAVHCQAFSTRSTDGGRTWSSPVSLDGTGRDDLGNLDLTEPVGFETRDGRIMCLIRPIYSPWMWETWSSDQGKSWSPCVRGPFPGWAPSAPVKTTLGVVAFPTRFPGLTLHLTRDDGTTWDDGGGGTYLDTSIWAMGSLLEVEPDVILFIYMDSWFKALRAQFIRVTPTGLEPVRR
jgi:hypothetical protein